MRACGVCLAGQEARGLRRILVEGGGVTVSRFLQAGLLDRLHLTVAPVLIGSGRPSITLDPITSLDEALRPACRRFTLGRDVLFDLDLRSPTRQPRGKSPYTLRGELPPCVPPPASQSCIIPPSVEESTGNR